MFEQSQQAFLAKTLANKAVGGSLAHLNLNKSRGAETDDVGCNASAN